jgi:cation diffusion facilitator CzcD-associated flavoprotein CzcO
MSKMLDAFSSEYFSQVHLLPLKHDIMLLLLGIPILAPAGISSNSLTPNRPSNWIPIREQYLRQPRSLKIITIGAGFSGLILAHKIQNQYKLSDRIEHVIYEKNPDIGGTWYQNRYPGVGCDIPAHIYTFSWEPNPDWSSFYVGGPEIFAYIKQTADKYNLTKDIQLNSKVVDAEWKESDGKWHVTIEQGGKIIHDVGDLLINACGVFNTWKWPDVDGLKDFQGHLVHSAQWIDDYDFQGKNVGLIGNGASAIQLLPQIQPIAAHVTCFIRNPTWIGHSILAEHAGPDGKNFKFTEE